MHSAIDASPEEISQSGKGLIEMICLVLTAAAAGAALFSSFIILPYRVSAVEKTLAAQAAAATNDHDILLRIEEDVKQIQKSIDHKP